MPVLDTDSLMVFTAVNNIFSKSSSGYADIQAYMDIHGINGTDDRRDFVNLLEQIISSEEYTENANS